MKTGSLKFLVSVVFLFGASCVRKNDAGTTTGNPVVVNLKVASSSQPPTVVKLDRPRLWSLLLPTVRALPPPAGLADSTGASIALNETWIVLKEIEYRSDESGGLPGEVKLTGPYAIDLLKPVPDSLGTALVAGPIRRFKAVLQKADFTLPSGAPAGLSGQAVYLSGSVNGHSFVVRSDEGVSYEVAGPNAVTPGANAVMLLTLRTANLLKKINLSAITSATTIDASNKVPATDPCPSIHPGASELYTCFKDGLRSEGDFGEDKGDDHELDNGDPSVK